MKRCPNERCGHFAKHGRAAEYRDEAVACNDCAAELVFAMAVIDAPVVKMKDPPLGWRRIGSTVLLLAVAYALLGPKSIASLSLAALGIGPMFYGLEIAYFVAVRLKRRDNVERAGIVLGVLIAAMQAWSILVYLRGNRFVDLFSGEPGAQVACAVSLVGGAVSMFVIARLISSYGIGHGVILLWVMAALPTLGRVEQLWDVERGPALLSTAIVMLATILVLRKRPQVPLQGVEPAHLAAFIATVMPMASVMQLVTTAILTFVLPKPSRATASDYALTLAFFAVLQAAPLIGPSILWPLPLAIVTAVAIDVIGEAIALRGGEWIVAVEVADHELLFALEQRLRAAGVAYFTRNRGVRQLLRFAGLVAPFTVFVRQEQHVAATEVASYTLGSA